MNGYLFASYSLIMALIFGYLVYVQGKLSRLRREVANLREELEQHPDR